MKAKQLIESATYGPDELKVIGKAFDKTWEQIAPHVSGRPSAHEAARMKLANVVLSLAKNGVTNDTESLAQAALTLMNADPTKL